MSDEDVRLNPHFGQVIICYVAMARGEGQRVMALGCARGVMVKQRGSPILIGVVIVRVAHLALALVERLSKGIREASGRLVAAPGCSGADSSPSCCARDRAARIRPRGLLQIAHRLALDTRQERTTPILRRRLAGERVPAVAAATACRCRGRRRRRWRWSTTRGRRRWRWRRGGATRWSGWRRRRGATRWGRWGPRWCRGTRPTAPPSRRRWRCGTARSFLSPTKGGREPTRRRWRGSHRCRRSGSRGRRGGRGRRRRRRSSSHWCGRRRRRSRCRRRRGHVPRCPRCRRGSCRRRGRRRGCRRWVVLYRRGVGR